MIKLFRPRTIVTETQAIWPGASGRLYEYYVKKIDTRFVADQIGNFIICRLVRQCWQPLYIGQGDIDKMALAIIKQGCVVKKQATHIHERLNPDPDQRHQEAMDIIRHHPEVFAPGGCMPRPTPKAP